MSLRREKFVSGEFVWAGLLLGALSLAPAALAQGQGGAAAAPSAASGSASGSSSGSGSGGAAGHSQGSSAAKSQAGSASATSSSAVAPAAGQSAAGNSEPQMVDQSAPATDSLAEAARRARAQKAKSGASAGAGAPKVYTEEKLSRLSGHGVSVLGDGSAGGSGSSGAESSYSGAGGNSEANAAGAGGSGEQYWRGRARAIRDQMAQCDSEISKLQDEIAKYGAVSVDPQSGAMQSIIYVNDRNAKIKQIEEQKAGLQAQMDALEDEGRKAGADAGWFR
ncbi:MAG: hypothetical protein WAL74_20880 [Candidatus Acidiferrales bacterium]